jgi:hypothetical protein
MRDHALFLHARRLQDRQLASDALSKTFKKTAGFSRADELKRAAWMETTLLAARRERLQYCHVWLSDAVNAL